MANELVAFPSGKQAEAVAYKDWANQQFATAFPGEGDYADLRQDAYGQWVTQYYGPPFRFPAMVIVDGSEQPGPLIEEPEDGPSMRADGVILRQAVWELPE